MNILFLSIIDIPQGTMNNPGIYTDTLLQLKMMGHRVFVACGHEKRTGTLEKQVIDDEGITVLHVPIGDVTETLYLKKGINTVLLPNKFTNAIRKNFKDVHFDLILYATPPVTLCSTVRALKKFYNAKTYLLLKDMWPEGISSLGVIRREGIIYKYFKYKEKAIYNVSDYIGCMSEASVQYLYKHYPQIAKDTIMVCPNSLAPCDLSLDNDEKKRIREKYSLPLNKILIVYGGNLGKAQGIDFLIENLRNNKDRDQIHFLIIGSGLEYPRLKSFVAVEKPKNVTLLERMPRQEYNRIMASCDVGMILLNYRLSVPNTPSRILDYMQAKLPVIACVDSVTDVGEIVEMGQFGWKCFSNDSKKFSEILDTIIVEKESLNTIGNNGYKYFLKHYTAEIVSEIIVGAVVNGNK